MSDDVRSVRDRELRATGLMAAKSVSDRFPEMSITDQRLHAINGGLYYARDWEDIAPIRAAIYEALPR